LSPRRPHFDSNQFKGLRRTVLVTGDARALYRPYGFASLSSPERYMEIARHDIYAANR
jgi:hypothetical protein